MDEYSEHFAPESSESKALRWEEALQRLAQLQSGDIVSGFQDGQELDLFALQVGLRLKDPTKTTPAWLLEKYAEPVLNNRGDRGYYGWYGNSRVPSRALLPKKSFAGKLKNYETLILDDFLPSDEEVVPIKHLAIFAELHSTGRGKIGICAKNMALSLPVSAGGHVSASYKDLPIHNAEEAVEALALEVQLTNRAVVLNGLRKVLFGGLPELGKR